MDGKKKEGVSVKEVEEFAKKHRFEVFFCLLFLLACIFGLAGMFGTGWSILLAMVGAALGVLLPAKIDHLLKSVFHFVLKQEKTLLIVLGAVALLIACILPFVVFFVVGAAGGHAMYHIAGNTVR
jgi:uncharacterized membrane protein